MRNLFPAAFASLFLTALPSGARADDPGLILVYPSHGTAQHFTIRGRFIEDDGVRRAKKKSSRWRNAWRNAKLLESDEIEDAIIEVAVGGFTGRATTDDDGVFEVTASLPAGKALTPGRHAIGARAIDDKGHRAAPTEGVLFVLPPKGLAVISDIDDTILHTGVTSKREMLKNALLKNAAQIEQVPGASKTYQAARAAGVDLIFYLSGSPQNFVRRIHDFLTMHKFPEGPLLLKNFGTDPTLDQETYKIAHLTRVFQRHPGLRFVLVGDSGEHDPELYTKIRGMYPTRIAGILIRKVEGGDDRPERFTNMTVIDDHVAAPTALLNMIKAARGPSAAPAP